MMKWTKITGLDDIDFDGLFAGTLPKITTDPDFWPVGVATDAAKREHILSVLDALWQMPNAAHFKVLLDGETIAALFGSVQGGQYTMTFALMRDDASGSRSYVYDPAWFQAIKDFAASEGATSGGMYFFPESHAYPSAKSIYGTTDDDLTYFEIGDKTVILMKLW